MDRFPLDDTINPTTLDIGEEPLQPVHPTEPEPAAPLKPRQQVLNGFTYRTEWPGSGSAIYVTVNDFIANGKRLPYEVFINSEANEHDAWYAVMSQLISAIFRRGGNVAFVAEELRAVFDPRGGAWYKTTYVPSIPALIGIVLEQHFRNIGYVRDDPEAGKSAEVTPYSSGQNQNQR